ncbi:MAG: hypothetical protein ACUVR6_09790 [Anaerolineae bacterium]
MRFTRILQWVALVTMLTMAVPAFASDGQPPGQIVFGQDFTLQSGQILDSDLVVFGGNVNIEAGSHVRGAVVVWGGDAEIAGTVEKDVFVLGGDLHLAGTAQVEGGLAVLGGTVQKDPGAQVRGEQMIGPMQWFGWHSGWMVGPWVWQAPTDHLGGVLSIILLRGVTTILRVILMAGLAGLVALLWPRAAARVGRSALEWPLNAFGMGLLTLIVGILLAVGLIITLCLAPVGAALALALVVAVLFGQLAIGIVIGERLMPTLTPRAVSPFWTAALGAGLLTLLIELLDLIPCVGWVGGFLVTCAALGAVVLTRFGTRE